MSTAPFLQKGSAFKHLFYLLLLPILLIIGCGDFVRDSSHTKDRITLYEDTNPDSILVYDTLSDYTEIPDADYEADIERIDIQIEDITDIDHNDIKDIIDDAPLQDTGDTSYGDTYVDCDCDVQSSCGKCYYPGTDGLSNKALKDRLYQLIKGHYSLGYDNARTKMFSEIDNLNGWVECVYTGFKLKTNNIPDPNIMNTEHTWPQSMGAGSEPARSDLFHLFPTKSEANSRRGNYPFGTVTNVFWSEGGSRLGTNSKGETVFEPRDIHKGNVARAMFYFSTRYQLPIDLEQENELKKWHTLDPVDLDEIERCNKINSYQKNRNPFVDWPDFVNRIEDF